MLRSDDRSRSNDSTNPIVGFVSDVRVGDRAASRDLRGVFGRYLGAVVDLHAEASAETTLMVSANPHPRDVDTGPPPVRVNAHARGLRTTTKARGQAM